MEVSTMPHIDENLMTDVKNILSTVENDVSLILFTSEEDCLYCSEMKELIGEIAELSDRLNFEVRDMAASQEVAEHFRIDKAPALVVMGEQDHGIRFYGIPAGFEFGTLLEVIRLVSQDNPELNDEVMAKLALLKEPVHLQVFVTPTCPYCPPSVVAAHKLAMASDLVTADMVEASEFPELSQKHLVMSVPKTVANSSVGIDGAMPEGQLIDWLLAEVNGGSA
ncbi:thioredoxin family protein [Gemmatimonadota bacterium]